MTKKEARVEYLVNYVTNFLSMLENLGAIQPMEALGCSNIVRKVMLFFPPSILINLPQPLLEAYLKQITQMTCHFMKAATHKDAVRCRWLKFGIWKSTFNVNLFVELTISLCFTHFVFTKIAFNISL